MPAAKCCSEYLFHIQSSIRPKTRRITKLTSHHYNRCTTTNRSTERERRTPALQRSTKIEHFFVSHFSSAAFVSVRFDFCSNFCDNSVEMAEENGLNFLLESTRTLDLLLIRLRSFNAGKLNIFSDFDLAGRFIVQVKFYYCLLSVVQMSIVH